MLNRPCDNSHGNKGVVVQWRRNGLTTMSESFLWFDGAYGGLAAEHGGGGIDAVARRTDEDGVKLDGGLDHGSDQRERELDGSWSIRTGRVLRHEVPDVSWARPVVVTCCRKTYPLWTWRLQTQSILDLKTVKCWSGQHKSGWWSRRTMSVSWSGDCSEEQQPRWRWPRKIDRSIGSPDRSILGSKRTKRDRSVWHFRPENKRLEIKK